MFSSFMEQSVNRVLLAYADIVTEKFSRYCNKEEIVSA